MAAHVTRCVFHLPGKKQNFLHIHTTTTTRPFLPQIFCTRHAPHMSNDEDYTTNIDEQLLTAVKNQVNGHGLGEPDRPKLEEKNHLQRHNSLTLQEQRAAEAAEAAQAAQAAQAHALYHHHQHLHDDSEYNIQIPDPIVDARLKIYPVNENTITNEGNLITRPFPEQIFQERAELNEFISEFARDNGFGIVIAHSNRKAIYYTCELGGRYRHKKGRTIEQQQEEAAAAQRQLREGDGFDLEPNARTKKLRCPFSMTALFRKTSQIWSLRTTCNEHNHPQLDPLSNHPMLRKRSDELNLLILDLYKVGTKPSHIEAKIKHQFPDVLIKREDIYNEIRGYKRKMKKQNKFLPGGISVNGAKRRVNAAAYHGVIDEDDEEDHDEVLSYELERQRQEAELQRQLQAAEAHHHELANPHSLSHHSHHAHLDEQQLHHYQQQLQAHGLHDAEHGDSTAAAAIAAVANAAHGSGSDDLSIDNIDSRLVGE